MSQDRWQNRRRMAWGAFAAGIGYPVLLLLTDSDQVAGVAMPFYTFVTGVLASYYGWATWDDKHHPPAPPHDPA